MHWRLSSPCAALSEPASVPDHLGPCWVESTTVWTRLGVAPTYSTVTWLLASGRSCSMVCASRTLACDSTRRCESWIGSGISASVSLQAKPNIMPWSPAPSSPLSPVSTPIAMSTDCCLIEESTAHETWSKAMSPEV